MGLYDKNLKALERKYTKLYSKLQDMNEEAIPHWGEIMSVSTSDKEKALVVQHNNQEYRLNSIYKPQIEAEKWISQFEFNNFESIITMFGFGNGLFARELIKKRKDNGFIFIIEPSLEIFIHVLKTYDVSDIISADYLCIVVDSVNEEDFELGYRNMIGVTNIKGQINCVHPQYNKIFREKCIEYWKQIREGFWHAQISMNTETVYGAKFLENNLKNMKYLSGIYEFSDLKILTNYPAIVVAAGPSLSRNVDTLKRAKGKAVIIAVDIVIDYLLDRGVEPDLIVTVDAAKPIKYFSHRDNIKIPLLTLPQTNYEIMNAHKGKKIYGTCNGFIGTIYSDLGKRIPNTQPGGSVATYAIALCLNLGFSEIVLVGHDLAYDGKTTHVGGWNDFGEKEIAIIKVEGVDGQPVESRTDWNEYLQWLKKVVFLNSQTKFIDTKDRGAKIEGAIYLSLEEVIEEYCVKEASIQTMIETINKVFTQEDVLKIEEYLRKSYKELDVIKEKAEKVIKLSKKQIEKCKQNKTGWESKSYFEEMAKINQYLLEQPVYFLLETYIKSSLAQEMIEIYQMSDDKKANIIETYEKSINIYNVVLNGIKFAKPLLAAAIDDVIETSI